MNCRMAALVLLVMGLAVLLAGCPQKTSTEAPKTETTVQPAAPTTAAEGETKTAEAGSTVDAKALVEDRCTQCHGIDKVEKEKGDAEEWGAIVGKMQQNAERMKKTPITDEEAAKIKEYLAATYPKQG
ncbi:MAG: hypothetical protein FJX75_22290 [Armatimonadetes bacterium]|nr:hypothetical protein [Armatimonadota bacterium]